MPVFQGFVGSAFKGQSSNADCQELMNWYLERAESPAAKSPNRLLPTPGFETLLTLPKSPIRATFAQNDRAFVVASDSLYEIYRDATYIERAMTVLATPSAPTVAPSPLTEALTTPATPIVTHGGALGSTTYGYKVTALNALGETDASVEGTSVYGNATLSATNFNIVSWAQVAGATGYRVYRTTGGSTPPKLIATVSSTILFYQDIGSAGTSITPPSSNTTGGVAGSTTYGYKVVATLGLGTTAASGEGVTHTGQATLTDDDFNIVAWNAVPNAGGYKVYRTTGGDVPKLIATVDADTLTVNDVGDADAEEDEAPPSADTTGTATITDDGRPVAIYSSGDAGSQLLIVGGGHAFVYDLEAGTLAKVVDGATAGGYIGSYFVVLDASTSTLKVSESLDGFTWDATQIYQRLTAGDRWLSMAVTHNEVWLTGSATTEVWSETGDDETRFAPINAGGIFIEEGILAARSIQRLGQTLIWLSQNEEGAGKVVQAAGYSARTISPPTVEVSIQALTNIADAVSFTYEMDGHGFYVLTFPTDGLTWVYDVTTGEWHQRSFRNINAGTDAAYRVWCHCFAFGGIGFGMHLVGDRASGRVLKMSNTYGSDVEGVIIRRVRRAPHLASALQRIEIDNLIIDVQPGIGLSAGQGSDPTMMLRLSKDGGQTFGHERWRSAGAQGKYKHRAKWDRWGTGRDLVFELVVTDPVVPWAIAAAYFNEDD